MTWCLVIQIAYPDYKRPSLDVKVYHYAKREDAEKRLKIEDDAYIANYGITRETFDDPVALADYVYADSYMENNPFDAHLFKVEPLENLEG